MQTQYHHNVKKILLSGNIELAYTEQGSGNYTLLFIHGLANYLPVWNKNFDFLKSKYKCIAIDLPGNGLSPRKNEYRYSINFYAQSVISFIDALKLKNVVLVGHSMGGQVAATIAIQQPELIKKLILCAPAGIEHFNDFEKSMFKNLLWIGDFLNADESYLSTTIKNSFEKFPNEAQQIIDELIQIIKVTDRTQYKRMVNESIVSMLNEPIHQFLNKISCPTLVLFGKNDAMIPNKILHPFISPIQIANDAKSKINHCDMHLIENCGHFLHFEKAEIINGLIAEFC